METYETLDIYIAAYLELRGLTVTLSENRGGRVVFSFPDSDELAEVMRDYNTGKSISAKSYADRIKDLKRRMFTVSNGQGLNHGNARR